MSSLFVKSWVNLHWVRFKVPFKANKITIQSKKEIIYDTHREIKNFSQTVKNESPDTGLNMMFYAQNASNKA